MNSPRPDPSARFTELLSRFPPGIVSLVEQCLPKLRRAFPTTHELVYDYAKSLVVSFGMSERGYEAIVALSISADAVRLYFDKTLPDPTGLLEGAGAKVRSVVLELESDLDRADIQALTRAAIARAGVTFARDGSTRIVFKSNSRQRKPAKAKQ